MSSGNVLDIIIANSFFALMLFAYHSKYFALMLFEFSRIGRDKSWSYLTNIQD